MQLFSTSYSTTSYEKNVLLTTVRCLLALSIWPAMAQADRTAADYFVHSLPGAPDGPLLKMHAGHIDVNEPHHGKLFFWHYQNRHIANKQRTVIWLNGGPGCSSEDGGLMEIGPYRLKDDATLEYNDGSWDEFANLLFVDNPAGTGFSSVDSDSYVHELSEMADQFIIFLEKFFAIFPHFAQDDLYLTGESYAGQHIPYIAKAILDRNKSGRHKQSWNLKGMLIGNGWISPKDQYPSYLEYAYQKGIVEKGTSVASQLEEQQEICLKSLDSNHVDIRDCEAILNRILQLTQTRGPGGEMECYNMYDVRLKDTFPSCGMNWPPDLVHVTPYLRRTDVLEALHVKEPNKTPQQPGWTECNGAVGSAFRARNSEPSINFLPALIEEVPTLLFSGAEDLICNHLGTEDLINNMVWNGGKGFELSPGTWAPRQDWTFEGEAAGIYQEARNLTYVLFYNSSHMVPFDYARRSREMLDRFIGVDIASIGGVPTDSRIDGEKGPATSVGGHTNSTAAETAEKGKIDAAKWHAYYRSGEIALVVVIILASAWAYFIWKDRRRRSGYSGVEGGNDRPLALGIGGPNFRRSRTGPRGDIEAADFDESELDELHAETRYDQPEERRYSVGSLSDDEGGGYEKGRNGHAAITGKKI